jgi:hypothetical protein
LTEDQRSLVPLVAELVEGAATHRQSAVESGRRRCWPVISGQAVGTLFGPGRAPSDHTETLSAQGGGAWRGYTKMSAIRLSYVGCGYVAQKVHIPNFSAIADCGLLALAEVRQELGRKVQTRFGIPRLFDFPQEKAIKKLQMPRRCRWSVWMERRCGCWVGPILAHSVESSLEIAHGILRVHREKRVVQLR